MSRITVGSLFQKSRQISQENFGAIWRVFFLYGGFVVLRCLMGLPFEGVGAEVSDYLTILGIEKLLVGGFLFLLDWLLWYGVIYMSVNMAIGQSIHWTDVFWCLESPRNFFILLLAAFVVRVVTFLGFLALVLPGIYLSVCYIIVLPILIVGEIEGSSLGVWEAMETSRKAVQPLWLTMFGWAIVKILLAFSCVFLIPIYWVLPILFSAHGVEWAAVLDRFPDDDFPAASEGYGAVQSDPEAALTPE